MSYVKHVLQEGEHVVAFGRLHWIGYFKPILILVIAGALLIVPTATHDQEFAKNVTAGALALLALIQFLAVWFKRWTTEIAVTDRRVIYKSGFIRRATTEMNLSRVEEVAVDQSILGRILDFGTIHVRGTGAGIENIAQVAHPLALRSAMTAPSVV